MESHLILSLDDDDRHWGGGPAVLGGEGLVAVPQDDDLKENDKDFIICKQLHCIQFDFLRPKKQLAAACS